MIFMCLRCKRNFIEEREENVATNIHIITEYQRLARLANV